MHLLTNSEFGARPTRRRISDSVSENSQGVLKYLATQHRISYKAVFAAATALSSWSLYSRSCQYPQCYHKAIESLVHISIKDHLWAKREILRLQRHYLHRWSREGRSWRDHLQQPPPDRRRSLRLRDKRAKSFRARYQPGIGQEITVPIGRTVTVPRWQSDLFCPHDQQRVLGLVCPINDGQGGE